MCGNAGIPRRHQLNFFHKMVATFVSLIVISISSRIRWLQMAHVIGWRQWLLRARPVVQWAIVEQPCALQGSIQLLMSSWGMLQGASPRQWVAFRELVSVSDHGRLLQMPCLCFQRRLGCRLVVASCFDVPLAPLPAVGVHVLCEADRNRARCQACGKIENDGGAMNVWRHPPRMAGGTCCVGQRPSSAVFPACCC